jgi:hypothetical protein
MCAGAWRSKPKTSSVWPNPKNGGLPSDRYLLETGGTIPKVQYSKYWKRVIWNTPLCLFRRTIRELPVIQNNRSLLCSTTMYVLEYVRIPTNEYHHASARNLRRPHPIIHRGVTSVRFRRIGYRISLLFVRLRNVATPTALKHCHSGIFLPLRTALTIINHPSSIIHHGVASRNQN